VNTVHGDFTGQEHKEANREMEVNNVKGEALWLPSEVEDEICHDEIA